MLSKDCKKNETLNVLILRGFSEVEQYLRKTLKKMEQAILTASIDWTCVLKEILCGSSMEGFKYSF